MFINDLPNGRDTKDFRLLMRVEARPRRLASWKRLRLAADCFCWMRILLQPIFMVRDAFMQKVVSPDKEPITPFLSRAVDLYEKAGISTILVAGSSGAFFHIADTVIQMDQYEPVDITEKAKRTVWTISDCAGDSKTICFTG